MENVLKPLTKSVCTPLVLTAAASAADTGRHKKKLAHGWLIISNKERDDIKEYLILLKMLVNCYWNSWKRKPKQKDGCISMLLGTLGARLLWNIITGKGVKTKIAGRWVMRAGEGTVIFNFTSSFN